MTIEPDACFLCEKPANRQGFMRWNRFQCPRCGTYGVTDEIEMIHPEKRDRERMGQLTRERHLKRLPLVVLTNTTRTTQGVLEFIPFDDVLSTYPQPGSDMIERALLNLGSLASKPGSLIPLDAAKFPVLFADSQQEAEYMASALVSAGWVNIPGGWTTDSPTLQVAPGGWDHIHREKTRVARSKQAFVAMRFHESTDAFWSGGIEPAIKDCGFLPLKINDKHHNNNICDEIIAEIRRSRFVVADFTGNRAGVYFEAGFAKGIGVEVIWTVHKPDLKDVHFDTNHFSHIVYQSAEELRKSLSDRIRATIT